MLIASAGFLYGQQNDSLKNINTGFSGGGKDTSSTRNNYNRPPGILQKTRSDVSLKPADITAPAKSKSDSTKNSAAKNNADTARSEISTSPQSDTIVIKEADIPQKAKDTTSLNFKDTDVRDVFRALSYQHHLNLFVDNSINKHVTISLSNVRVFDAIKFICEQQELSLKLEGGIFKIMPPPPQPKPEPPPPKIPWVYYENDLLSVQLKNDDLDAVIQRIQEKSKKNILLLNGTTGSISGTLNDIDFDLGFTQLMNNNGFAVQKKNGVYTVCRLDYFVGSQGGQKGDQKAGPPPQACIILL